MILQQLAASFVFFAFLLLFLAAKDSLAQEVLRMKMAVEAWRGSVFLSRFRASTPFRAFEEAVARSFVL